MSFDAQVLVIDHQLQRVRRALLHRETKTEASDASLPMPAIVTTALTLRRQEQDASRAGAGKAWRGLDAGPQFVLTGRDGDLSVTMEIYAKASSAATTEALRRLGDSLQ